MLYTQHPEFPPRTINVNLPQGQYYFRIQQNATILSCQAGVSAPPGTGTSTGGSGGGSVGGVGGSLPPPTPSTAGSTIITYTGETSKTIRRTYQSPTLPRGRYEIRVRKTNSPVDDKHIQDTFLNDVSEIQNSKVTLGGLATGWYVIKMSDQLSGIPTVTWPVKGVKVDIYDKTGAVTATQWSDNPADIVLDMLISVRRGSLRGKINIDFPAFVQWRTFCTTNGLKFNGVFDEMTTLWDALQQVFKVGRAYPTRIGTKLSVAMDAPATPVMLFGSGNIFKDSFQISYLPLQDRATEFEVSYYDKDDLNKKKTIRIADPTVAQAGEIPKTAQYELFGIDNFDQAQKEVWYQLYQNRLARRVITFDAPIESIGLTLGDVAYIQHDMVEWGISGRVANGNSTTSVTLDRPVDILAGSTYKLLVVHDKLQKTTATLASGNTATRNLTGLTSGLDTSTLKRLVTNVGDEAQILDFTYTGTTTATVVLDRIVTGATATIWDVDVIEERTVNTTAGTGLTTVTVSSAFTQIPSKYANFMFGQSTSVKRPYRLRAIKGDSLDRRTLVFGEYNALVYSPPETTIPAPVKSAPKYPSQVKNLRFNTDLARTGESTARGILTWTSGDIYRYGGADIYIAQGAKGEFNFLKTVQNTNMAEMDVQEGAILRFKVVAFNQNLLRAPINTAPVVGYNIITGPAGTGTPTGGTTVTEHTRYRGSARVSWQRQSEHTELSRIQLRRQTDADWIDYGLTRTLQYVFSDLPFGSHMARVRAEKNNNRLSEWYEIPFVIEPDPLPDPTQFSISHTLNTDGSANIVLNWEWDGNPKDIDGFEITTYQGTTNTPYTLHSDPTKESAVFAPPTMEAYQWHGVPADKFYTFFVRAFKWVDSSAQAQGIWVNPSTSPAFTAYQPSTSVAFTGDIQGTINGTPASDISNALEGIINDQIVTAKEKQDKLRNTANELESDYKRLLGRANAHSLDTSAVTTRRTLWTSLLDSWQPKWNDTKNDTTIFQPFFDVDFLNDWASVSGATATTADAYFVGGSGNIERFSYKAYLDFVRQVYNLDAVDYNLLSSVPSYFFTRTGQQGALNRTEPFNGPEIIINGTFDSDTTGWNPSNNATISAVGGRLRVAADGITFGPGATMLVNLTVGKTYRFTAKSYAGSVPEADIRVHAPNSNIYYGRVTGPTSYVADFTFSPTVSQTYIDLLINSTPAAGAYVEFDEISLKEVIYKGVDFFATNTPAINTAGYHSYNTTSNVVLQSNSFSVSPWVTNNTTVVENAIVAPDSTVTADKIVEGTGSDPSHYIYQGNIPVAASTTYTASVFVKRAVNARDISISVQDGSGSNGVTASFDLGSGAVSSAEASFGTGWTAGTANISPMSQGWYRVMVDFTTPSAGVVGGVTLVLKMLGGSGVSTQRQWVDARGTMVTEAAVRDWNHSGEQITESSSSGDGVSSLYLWGGQLSIGRFGNGGPIITTTTTTIGLSNTSLSVANILPTSDFIAWTTFNISSLPTASVGSSYILSFSNETGTDFLSILLTSGGLIGATINVNGVTQPAPGSVGSVGIGTNTLLIRRQNGLYSFAIKRADGSTTIGAPSTALGLSPITTKIVPGAFWNGGFNLNGRVEGVFVKTGSFDDTDIITLLGVSLDKLDFSLPTDSEYLSLFMQDF